MTLDQRTIKVFVTSKTGITHAPSFICLKRYFCLYDLEMDCLTLQMTLSHRNNTRNGLPKLKSHENDVLHLFLASFVEKSYLTLKYLAAILFSH